MCDFDEAKNKLVQKSAEVIGLLQSISRSLKLKCHYYYLALGHHNTSKLSNAIRKFQ